MSEKSLSNGDLAHKTVHRAYLVQIISHTDHVFVRNLRSVVDGTVQTAQTFEGRSIDRGSGQVCTFDIADYTDIT